VRPIDCDPPFRTPSPVPAATMPRDPSCRPLHALVALLLVALVPRWAPAAEATVVADFSRPDHGWSPKAATLRPRADGVAIEPVGDDPWILGPLVDLPGGGAPGTRAPDRMLVELEATAAAAVRCFVAPEGGDFSEGDAADLVAGADGVFRAILPRRAARARFRLDPPDGDPSIFHALRVRPVETVFALPLRPEGSAPLPPLGLPDDALEVSGGIVTVRHDRRRWNALEVWVGGTRMADSLPDEALWTTDGLRAVAIDPTADAVTVTALPSGYEVGLVVREPGDPADAATWTLTRRVEPADRGVRLETSVAVDRRREVRHLPWLTLLAGLGSFGTEKSQALLPGVEYLDDEPSSNERAIRGAAANRRLPDPLDVCFPMMALAAAERWLAIDWDPSGPAVSPLFDSPDRVYHSGGHALGLWSPAAGGADPLPARFPGDLSVTRGTVLEPGTPLSLAVVFRGGFGGRLHRAVADRFRVSPPPPPPDVPGGFDGACRLLAHGWLDSAIRSGALYRHAVWPGNFPPQPAADAPPCMRWLATHVDDSELAARLREAAAAAQDALPPGEDGGVGHVGRPALPLLCGGSADAARDAILAAGARARRLAATIRAGEGRLRWEGGALGSTLGADSVNGLTAITAERMLDAAVLSGDEETVRVALDAADLVARAHPAGEVPRGAQPWEIPLHAPDILAAARMTRVHLLGHLLDGRPRRLEQARAWAWSGMPLVYLRDPLPDGAVGRYATIGVLGATGWEAPLWIGRPVPWCGLVHAAALAELARVDVPLGDTWRRVAGGITRGALLMTFPADDPRGRGGLLPDFWLFRQGRGDGPAINPATLQATLAEAFGEVPLVSATRLPGTAGHGGHVIHVAGEVERTVVGDARAEIDVAAWPEEPSLVVITRVAKPPARVTWEGTPLEGTHVADCLVVPVTGRGTITVEW